jgi:hypothetical protein
MTWAHGGSLATGGFGEPIYGSGAVQLSRSSCRLHGESHSWRLRAGYDGRVTKPLLSGSTTRHAAVADLFDALEAMVVVYRSVPADDQARRWSDDAERITGDVARHLSTARDRLSATIPTAVPEPR